MLDGRLGRKQFRANTPTACRSAMTNAYLRSRCGIGGRGRLFDSEVETGKGPRMKWYSDGKWQTTLFQMVGEDDFEESRVDRFWKHFVSSQALTNLKHTFMFRAHVGKHNLGNCVIFTFGGPTQDNIMPPYMLVANAQGTNKGGYRMEGVQCNLKGSFRMSDPMICVVSFSFSFAFREWIQMSSSSGSYAFMFPSDVRAGRGMICLLMAQWSATMIHCHFCVRLITRVFVARMCRIIQQDESQPEWRWQFSHDVSTFSTHKRNLSDTRSTCFRFWWPLQF